MKVLVFGTSDSGGDNLTSRELAWPWQAAATVSAARSEPVEIVHRLLYLEAGGALAYVERELLKHRADAVVLTTSAYSFTFRTVPFRIRKAFGQRAGDWVAERIRQFDDLAGEDDGWRNRAREIGHTAGQKLIGTSAQASFKAVLANYLLCIDRLAALEATPVVVIGSAQFRGDLAKKWPRQESMIIDFNRRLEAACANRRVAWVDKEGMTRAIADRDAMYLDPVHKGQEYHDRLGVLVARCLLD